MIPTSFNVLGAGGKNLVGIRPIGNSYIDTGVIPRFGYESTLVVHSWGYETGDNLIQIAAGVHDGVNRIDQIFWDVFYGHIAFQYSASLPTASTTAPFSSFSYPVAIQLNKTGYTVNGTTSNYPVPQIELPTTKSIWLFYPNGSTSDHWFKGVISAWDYSDDTQEMRLRPQIVDGKARMVDVLTGNIPTHYGEFAPVYN